MAELTEWQAFVAMFRFLLEHWERCNRAGEISDVLSEIGENARPGNTADPAIWDDWLKAVEWSRARSEDLTVADEREGDDGVLRMPRKRPSPG
jgi:hypothetical protein